MSPTSRNTLMIGGALIAIALLLVCGPLSDRFGSRGGDDQEPPAVAAGPPPDAIGAAGAAAVGALAGATAGEAGVERLAGTADPCRTMIDGESEADRDRRLRDHDCLTPAASGTTGEAATAAAMTAAREAGEEGGEAIAGLEAAGNASVDEEVAGLAATTAAVVAATSGGSAAAAGASAGSSGTSAAGSGIAAAAAEGAAEPAPLPSVSAGLRGASESAAALATDVAAGVGALATATPALAAAAFDEALAPTGSSRGGIGPAGPVVRRFPPPVAALGASPSILASAQPFIDSSSPVVLPCDSPGSGCANIRPPANPPFVPGRRPPLSAR